MTTTTTTTKTIRTDRLSSDDIIIGKGGQRYEVWDLWTEGYDNPCDDITLVLVNCDTGERMPNYVSSIDTLWTVEKRDHNDHPHYCCCDDCKVQ